MNGTEHGEPAVGMIDAAKNLGLHDARQVRPQISSGSRAKGLRIGPISRWRGFGTEKEAILWLEDPVPLCQWVAWMLIHKQE